MLLRNSMSSTKKFFQKSLESFKSFFSGNSYQRMPKTSPYDNPRTYNHLATDINVQNRFKAEDLDTFYDDFNDRWENDEGKARKRNKKKRIPPSSAAKQEQDELNGSFMKFSKAIPVKDYQIQKRDDYNYNPKNKLKGFQGGKKWQLENSSNYKDTRDQGRSWLLAQKLKELEMMDVSNVDHVLDIEEVRHYYSRLTCPAYLDIVEKFFMDMYTEFFGPPGTPRSVNSRKIRLPSMRS